MCQCTYSEVKQIPVLELDRVTIDAMGSNLKNAVIAFLVPLPSIFFYLSLLNHHHANITDGTGLSPLWAWCVDHPLLLVNILFFFNVNVLFWFISHIQSSHWVYALFRSLIFFFSSSISLLDLIFFPFLGADDRSVLDCYTDIARLLLCNIPFCPV